MNEIRKQLEDLGRLKDCEFEDTIEYKASMLIKEQQLKIDRLEACLDPLRWSREMRRAWDNKRSLESGFARLHLLALEAIRDIDEPQWDIKPNRRRIYIKD